MNLILISLDRTNMKKILFCLLLVLFSGLLSAQKVAKDSIIVKKDSIFQIKTQVIYKHVPDTMELHARYMQIETIISTYRDEQELIKEKILFFEENKPSEFLRRNTPVRKPKQKKPATKKKPAPKKVATKPKKQ